MKVRGDRLAADLEAVARYGRDPAGGMTRLALSEGDAQARTYVRDQMIALGMTVAHDDVGNLIGRREGTDAGAPSVMTGSHLDTVPRGGRYDGPLGVVGALEAVRALDEAGVRSRRAIDVVVFVGEEGSRFGRGTIGSAALCGEVPVAQIHALADKDGVSFAGALKTYGDAGAPRPAAQRAGSVAAFVELHIEQGGVLESRRLAIGAVTAVAGLVQPIIKLRGDANHAGATPMDLRKDALCCAAEIALAVERIAGATKGGAVATTGRLEVEPGAFNIIPGAVTMGIDVRSPIAQIMTEVDEAIRAAAREAAARRGIGCDIGARQRVEPGPLDEQVISAVERAAAARGLSSTRMPSGAIHDALHMAFFCPSGMIFVPSKGGKSHCPEEDTAIEDMLNGVGVLAGVLADLASS